jgi:mono/diheme cytochrome c family protein
MIRSGRTRYGLGAAMAAAVLSGGCTPRTAEAPAAAPRVVAANTIEAGRYLALVGGCNDCHTPGYPQNGGTTPEVDRMTGDPVGRRGPWGVSYPTNLRLLTHEISEDEWVVALRGGKSLPPMPTANMSKMHEADLRALYQYIKSLGPKGEKESENLPPGQEPTTPYENMTPVEPARAG